MSEVPLTGDEIRSYLHEVAEALGPDGPSHTLVLVGGSLLALVGLRASTVDVDTIGEVDAEVSAAVRVVAAAHGLAPRWLNDSAAAFVPVTFEERDCQKLFDVGRLQVLGAPLSQVFVMKLHAHRPQDVEDMARLWARTGFSSPEDAARAYALAYPHEDPDPHLADFIAEAVAGSD